MPAVFSKEAVEAEVKRLAGLVEDAPASGDLGITMREAIANHTLAMQARIAELEQANNELGHRADQAAAEATRMRELINTPHLYEFAEAVVMEALHQRQRWPSDHDAGKTDADWHWLLAYLAGKALHNPPNSMPPLDAKLHRIIAAAAACANWHAAVAGEHTAMRPGIAPPDSEGMER